MAGGGVVGHAQTTNVVSTNGPAHTVRATVPAAPAQPAPAPVKPKYEQAPYWRDAYHYSQHTDPSLLAAYSRAVHDSESTAQAEKADRLSWANTERIFRLRNDQAGESFIDDPVVIIYPPGK